MLLLVCFLVFAEAALTAKNAVYVLSTYTSNNGAANCNQANFLETAYEFAQKNSYSYMWCAQTPTSYLNYLFVFTNSSVVAVQSFDATNTNCTGSPLNLQYITLGSCVHLTGDNPAVSYKISAVNGGCDTNNCSGQQGTCCYAPSGNSCGPTGSCCCPDFQNACESGSSCICGGECPGTGCQCLGCGPANEGFCLNQ